MVAHIHRHYIAVSGHAPRNHPPIARRPKQAMHNQQRRQTNGALGGVKDRIQHN
jgi:hypothetical protein